MWNNLQWWNNLPNLQVSELWEEIGIPGKPCSHIENVQTAQGQHQRLISKPSHWSCAALSAELLPYPIFHVKCFESLELPQFFRLYRLNFSRATSIVSPSPPRPLCSFNCEMHDSDFIYPTPS